MKKNAVGDQLAEAQAAIETTEFAAAPATPAPAAEAAATEAQPVSGGSYIRQADGTLQREEEA